MKVSLSSLALALSFAPGALAVRHVSHLDDQGKMLLAETKWEDLWCVQHRIAEGESCSKAVAAMVEKCAAWKKGMADATLSKVQHAHLALDHKCETFYKEQRECQEKALQREAPQKLGAVVHKCEAAVHEVCAATVCPTYCALTGNTGPCEDCAKTCAGAEQKMFQTGSLECAEGEEWAKCLQDFRASLTQDGRFAEMEALMREHLVKCVCVSARDDDSVCYNDEDDVGLGISPGQKWCDFYNTPSWRRLVDISPEEANSRGLVDGRWTVAPNCEAKVDSE